MPLFSFGYGVILQLKQQPLEKSLISAAEHFLFFLKMPGPQPASVLAKEFSNNAIAGV
jgi:hypothetical protein